MFGKKLSYCLCENQHIFCNEKLLNNYLSNVKFMSKEDNVITFYTIVICVHIKINQH